MLVSRFGTDMVDCGGHGRWRLGASRLFTMRPCIQELVFKASVTSRRLDHRSPPPPILYSLLPRRLSSSDRPHLTTEVPHQSSSGKGLGLVGHLCIRVRGNSSRVGLRNLYWLAIDRWFGAHRTTGCELLKRTTAARSVLQGFFARLPNTGSSSSSGLFGDGSTSNPGTSTSDSVVPCSTRFSGESGGNSVCNVPRKKKTPAPVKRRRSNLAVILVEPGDSVVPLKDSTSQDIVEVISLSSGASTTSVENVTKDKGKRVLLECDDGVSEKDEDCVDGEPVKKKVKKSYESSRKFQDTWAARLPWAELHRGGDGLYESVKCLVCSTVEGKAKIMGPKWDTLKKHGGKRRATCDMSNGIKKDQWYIAKNCKHLRNERIYAARSQTTVLEQVTVLKGERARKQIQFATILHLLHEGRPMMEYSALNPLLSFLGIPKLPKKHWSCPAGWELAECLYKQVQAKTKATLRSARFFCYM